MSDFKKYLQIPAEIDLRELLVDISLDPAESEHISIDVSATPEEIEQHKFTVTFTALDDIGVMMLKDMQ